MAYKLVSNKSYAVNILYGGSTIVIPPGGTVLRVDPSQIDVLPSDVTLVHYADAEVPEVTQSTPEHGSVVVPTDYMLIHLTDDQGLPQTITVADFLAYMANRLDFSLRDYTDAGVTLSDAGLSTDTFIQGDATGVVVLVDAGFSVYQFTANDPTGVVLADAGISSNTLMTG